MKTIEHAAFIALTKEHVQQMFPNGFTVIDQTDFESLAVGYENLEAKVDKLERTIKRMRKKHEIEVEKAYRHGLKSGYEYTPDEGYCG